MEPARADADSPALSTDVRLLPRVLVRVVVASAAVAAAAELAGGSGVAVLGGLEPPLGEPGRVAAAVLHAAAAVALLSGRARRLGAAALGAALLAWLVLAGAMRQTGAAVWTGVLFALALSSAEPDERGPWSRAAPGPVRLAASWVLVAFLGLVLRRVTEDAWLVVAVAAGAGLHARALGRIGRRRPVREVLLLWLLVVWAGAGGTGRALMPSPGDAAWLPPTWPPAGARVLEAALGVLGLACYRWRRVLPLLAAGGWAARGLGVLWWSVAPAAGAGAVVRGLANAVPGLVASAVALRTPGAGGASTPAGRIR